MADKLPRRRRVLFSATTALLIAATILLALLVAEGLASVIFSARDAAAARGISEESHSDYDPELGWANQPSLRLPDLYGPGISYTTNAQGFRSTSGDYSTKPPEGRYRIIVLGDSVAMGYGVADDETYPAQMESLCPQLEVVNMGLGGYGLGQDYLWYLRDGVELETDLLVFAFFSANFNRMASDRFLGYGKPLLVLDNGVLRADNVPVPQTWGSRRAWKLGQFVAGLSLRRAASGIRGAMRGSQARAEEQSVESFADVAGAILEELSALSLQRGQDFVAVYLPLAPVLAEEPGVHARWLADFAGRSDIPSLDLTPDLAALEPAELTLLQLGGEPVPGVSARPDRQRPDPHYSPRGNRFVAERLLAHLKELFPDLPC